MYEKHCVLKVTLLRRRRRWRRRRRRRRCINISIRAHLEQFTRSCPSECKLFVHPRSLRKWRFRCLIHALAIFLSITAAAAAAAIAAVPLYRVLSWRCAIFLSITRATNRSNDCCCNPRSSSSSSSGGWLLLVVMNFCLYSEVMLLLLLRL